jgi:UDP-glucose 4-epimerase
MKKILITGGAGFIGAHLANKLNQNSKNQILIVDLLKKKGGIPYVDPKNKFIKGSITNPSIIKKIEKWRPKIIYHLAAQAGSEGSYEDPKNDLLTNGYGTFLIAKLAKKIKCEKFIYTSTVAVYGSNKKKVINEKTLIEPDSLYGISKYSGELFIRHLLKETRVKTYIFRVFNTYGPGENLNNLKKGMVSIFCSYVWKNKPIVVKGSLDRFRNFVYIEDCINILADCIKNNRLNNFEIFNLTSKKKTYVKELVNSIIRLNKKKNYKVVVKKNTPGDSFGFHSSNIKLRKKFPNIKFTTIEKGVGEYFNWIKLVPKKMRLDKYHPLIISKQK